jgi:ribosomal protein L21E
LKFGEEPLTTTDPRSTHINQKSLSKPTFSFTHGAWEIDLAYGLLTKGDIYLICVNVNTRYLVVYELSSKTRIPIIQALTELRENYHVDSLKGDGEGSFASLDIHIDRSPYTIHNKIVDRVIRTISDAIYTSKASTEPELQQIVNYYNNTYHSAIDCTPEFMQKDPDAEDQYIRWCINKLDNMNKKLKRLGYYDYKVGDRLLLHLDESKTSSKFAKKRAYWGNVGVFVGYKGRSTAIVSVANRKTIELPLYFTKKLRKPE